jgi:protein-tyrosine phosphatase
MSDLEAVDPTRIELSTDPQTRRMVGVATHGMTPFDVPYISEISENIWQGGCADGMVAPEFLDVVVSLYPWEKYELSPRQDRWEYKMYDSTRQGFDQVEEIASLVADFALTNTKVLVHCQAGLNRSSLIVARALMLLDGLTGQEAIDLIREKRSPACLCNPSFSAWLQGLE